MTKTASLLASVLSLILVAGCATSSTPEYDARFGEAVRQARMKQTLNPAAGANPDRAAGIDGRAAREAQIQYVDSFKKPPPVINVINIGGGAGSAR